ncbi:MAG: hypothetical protein IKE01_01695 [Clostridia bacterium]|nr:hypothetical protein [Clostridia bacterium]
MIRKKRIISYILSILFVIFLTATILLANVNVTLLRADSIKSKLVQANYYEEVYNTVTEACNNYIMQSGFESSIMDGVITKYGIEKDVNGLVDNLYEGKEYKINDEDIKSKLDKNIQSYVEQNGFEIDEEDKNGIEEFKNAIVDTYKRNIEFSHDTVKGAAKYVKKARKIASIGAVVLAIVSVLALVLIYKVCKPVVGVICVATGALCVALKCYSGTNVAVSNILVLSKAFSEALISAVNEFLQNVFVVGIVLCIVGIIWIIVFESKRRISKMQLLEEHSQIIR